MENSICFLHSLFESFTKRFAFVQFQEEQHAKNANEKENGTDFSGNKLDVKPAQPYNKGGVMVAIKSPHFIKKIMIFMTGK